MKLSKKEVLARNTFNRAKRYVNTLVKVQPRWLKELFDAEKVRFAIEDDFELILEVDVGLDAPLKDKIQTTIHKYLINHPASFLCTKGIDTWQ